MRHFTPIAFLVLFAVARAEEPVELKWHLAKGDRFSLEIASEAHQEHNETENNTEATRTLRLSAVMEVVEAAGGEAKVEVKILRTTGKSRFKDTEVEDTDLGTEASDWKKPLKGTISKRGSLTIDAADLVDGVTDTEVPLFDAFNDPFPLLPENEVKTKETWAGRGDEMNETWQVASVKKASAVVTAFLEGSANSEEKVKLEDGKKEGTRTMKGAMKAEFEVTAGYLKIADTRFVMEIRTPSKGKPLDLATLNRTVTVKKLEPAKK